MAKTAIITRAFNRLEYTVMCIREVNIFAGIADYEHIIIEQDSSDGTKQWLKSLEKEGYYNIRVKYNTINTGDAGGMKDGFDMSSDDCKYILQLDNDLIPLTDNFIQKLADIMDNDSKIGSIMLKREGVSTCLPLGSCYKDNLYRMTKLHGMFFRKSLLKEIGYWVNKDKIGWVKEIPKRIEKLGYYAVKSPDIKVMHIDTTSGQKIKYPVYFQNTKKNTNYKNLSY